MKKIIILSLLATLVSVLGISAQENTYSMVIKLNNGTVLTIGPNEVDSISFNDGQVAFSGENISRLVEKVDSIGEANRYFTHEEIINRMEDEMQNSRYQSRAFNTTLTRLIAPNIYIQDSYWYVNGEKTNKYADENSLYVGDNGNWWLGRYSWGSYYNGMDTGIKARSIEEVYQYVNNSIAIFYTKEELDQIRHELMQKIAVLEAEIENLKK